MEIKRKKFQGVLNILSFNRHFYVYGLLALAILIAGWWWFQWPGIVLTIIVASFCYGLIVPLIVSAYVYDFSGYYRLDWLKAQINATDKPKLSLNINAGFDETSFLIKQIYPGTDLRVFDFYDATRHTEPAIKRARQVTLLYPNTQHITSNHIPLPDKTVDVIFLLSSLHEIRLHSEKIQFLKECKRVCKPGGQVIMMEHLRDLPNFLSFTVGFTHFFSRKTWKNAFDTAGFTRFKETKFTPFMSVFNCQP